MNDLNQDSTVPLLMTFSTALADEGLFELCALDFVVIRGNY